MTSRRRVSMTSGTSANGIPNDSTTWDRTSARVGVDPDGEHRERGREREGAPEQQGDAAAQVALEHDLPGERAHTRRGEARREQRQRERERRRAVDGGQSAVHPGKGVGVRQAKGLPRWARGATGGGPTDMIKASARKRPKSTRERAESVILRRWRPE
jgi:hypothetical protein